MTRWYRWSVFLLSFEPSNWRCRRIDGEYRRGKYTFKHGETKTRWRERCVYSLGFIIVSNPNSNSSLAACRLQLRRMAISIEHIMDCATIFQGWPYIRVWHIVSTSCPQREMALGYYVVGTSHHGVSSWSGSLRLFLQVECSHNLNFNSNVLRWI